MLRVLIQSIVLWFKSLFAKKPEPVAPAVKPLSGGLVEDVKANELTEREREIEYRIKFLLNRSGRYPTIQELQSPLGGLGYGLSNEEIRFAQLRGVVVAPDRAPTGPAAVNSPDLGAGWGGSPVYVQKVTPGQRVTVTVVRHAIAKEAMVKVMGNFFDRYTDYYDGAAQRVGAQSAGTLGFAAPVLDMVPGTHEYSVEVNGAGELQIQFVQN